MGYVGTAYGVGMLLGPTLGGHLARTNVRLASWAAAAGSLASVVSILVSLPPDARPSKPAAAAASAGGAGAGGAARPPGPRLADVWRVCCLAGMPSLLAVKALSGFASALLQSATPLFLASRFGLDARGTGLVMSFSGAVSILAQAVAVAWLCVRFSDRTVVASCALATLPCFLLLACAGSVPTLCAALAPLLLASTVLSTVNTAQITKAAASDLGSAVAVDLSVGSALRIGTPTAAAAALQGLGYASVGGISAAATALLLLLIAVGAVDAAPAAAAAAAQSVAAKLQ